MIGKIVLVMGLYTLLNVQAESAFFDKKIYKVYTDKKGIHKIYAENYTMTYDNKKIKRIKKIKSYLNNTLEWFIEDKYYLTKTISSYSVIEDLDKDDIKDIILVYGFATFGPAKGTTIEDYVDFRLAIIYKNQVAEIMHYSDADDCFRYTEVDKVFYTFPKSIINRTIKVLHDIRLKHSIPIVYNFKEQMKNKNKYLWDYKGCRGSSYPWNDAIYGYIDLDRKRKVKLYKDFTSLSNYFKESGIKESKIRALNPWINKKATNYIILSS